MSEHDATTGGIPPSFDCEGESTEPRPIHPPSEPTDPCIVKAVIYPTIGIARVGNSPDAYFIGPEVPEPPAEPPGFYRDERGRLKRQAARFRVYGVDAEGRIIQELSSAQSKAMIRWTVKLANTKAAWYTFQLALDIPEASMATPATLRNAGVADRTQLSITPSAQTVDGFDAQPKRFDDGSFMGSPVYLGEIKTDEEGRLLVLGGHGVSRSSDGSMAITFANNENWHDDVSDGPVTAEVTLNGGTLDVVPAWVVVAPPNYGPQRKSVRTMWDLMRDVAITAGTLTAPVRPSYAFDILPMFERLAGLQWVNAGFAAGFGWKSLMDFTDASFLARLGDNGPAERELRHVVANQFRVFDVDSWSPAPWPWIYGDAMNIPPAKTPRQYAALTNAQLAMLKKWAAGDFEADYDPDRRPPASIDEVPPADQGDTLTRAALEYCLADAFHPGCEMTWPVRAASIYMSPFRIAHQPPGWKEPALGQILTSDTVTIPNGPLFGQPPGGITRWMAVPWQTDTASCRSGYDKTYDPYVPSFWPARVPNQVLTKENYAIVIDQARPLGERLAAFANRASWLEPLGSKSYTDQINNMIKGFGNLGVVEVLPGPNDTDLFPADLEVEDQHKPITDDAAEERSKRLGMPEVSGVGSGQRAIVSAADVDLSNIDKVHRFPGIRR
jgi:L-Lysine epsilon oxidase N-terminal/L-lysine epsilon oxidase C-terminal domain